nr:MULTISPECIES: VanZ family protein [Bosea]
MRSVFIRDQSRKMALAAGWIVLAIIIWASVSSIDKRPDSGLSVNLERELAFALLGMFFAIAARMPILIVFLYMLAFTASLETLQDYVPGRHGRVEDFIVKSLGVAVGMTIGVMIKAWADRARGALP